MRVRVCQLDGVNPLRALPLAAGLLASAARGARLDLDLRVLPGGHGLAEAAAACADADVLALSLYPWNLRHSLDVARRVKAARRSCKVVAGGPSVPRRREAAARFMRRCEVLDVVAFGEGEATFPELLRAFASGGDLDGVAGIAHRSGRDPAEIVFTGPGDRLVPSAACSPYLDGTFDEVLARSRERPAAAILETNRGCPYRCAFCSRGHEIHDRIVDLPAERVRDEIEWIAGRGIPYLYIVDSNFGIRPRDAELARHVADLRRRTGFPAFCYVHFLKSAREDDLAIPEALLAGGVRTQVAFATQDFEESVLHAVRRRNPERGRILELRRACHEKGIPTFDEILLGLPRQTYPSFVRTIVRALSPLPEDTFFLYLCRVAENSELARPEFRRRYGIETRRCVSLPVNLPTPPEVTECEEIVVATRDMPREDFRGAYRLGYLAVAAHGMRLLRATIECVRARPGGDVGEFLEGLSAAVAAAPEATVLGAFRRTLDAHLDSIDRGGPLVLPTEGAGPAPMEVADALTVLALMRPDDFFEEVRDLIRDFVAPASVAEDLVAFEAFRTPRFGVTEGGRREFRHDWLSHERRPGGDGMPDPVCLAFRPPPYASAPTLEEFARLHLAALHSRGDRGGIARVASAGRDAS